MRPLLAVAVLVLLPTLASASTASFTGLGHLGGSSSGATGISSDGRIVVGDGTTAGNINSRVFRWTATGGLELLGAFGLGPDDADVGRGVSDDGRFVAGLTAYAAVSDSDAWRLVVGSGFQPLGDLLGGGGSAQARDVSADGSVVVGLSGSASGLQAFRWTRAGGMVGLGDLPGGGFFSRGEATSASGDEVVGYSQSSLGTEPFLWTATAGMIGLGALPGADVGGVADGISANGKVVVGNSENAAGIKEAFRWTTEEGMTGLGVPDGAFHSGGFDASADGSVVVGWANGGGGDGAFVWNATQGRRRLVDVLTDLGVDVAGWDLRQARAVSDDGRTIAGWGLNPSGQSEAWVATIPTPAALTPALTPVAIATLLLVLGAIGAALLATTPSSGSPRKARLAPATRL